MEREYGRDFSSDVKLDKFQLDREAEMQASLVQYWTKEYGDALTAKARKEAEIKYIEGQRAVYYKTLDEAGLAQYGLKKTTDATVDQLVAQDPLLKQAKDEYFEILSDVNTLKAAVDAIREKGDMLKIETSLLIGGFYSTTQRNPPASV